MATRAVLQICNMIIPMPSFASAPEQAFVTLMMPDVEAAYEEVRLEADFIKRIATISKRVCAHSKKLPRLCALRRTDSRQEPRT
jgi:hypothetical protein